MGWAFIDMMTTDDLNRATAAAARVADPRLAAFHDPTHMLGRAIARRLGWKGHVAWDTYLVYRPGLLWKREEMPPPDEWFHQLKDREVWEQTAEADVGTADWTHACSGGGAGHAPCCVIGREPPPCRPTSSPSAI